MRLAQPCACDVFLPRASTDYGLSVLVFAVVSAVAPEEAVDLFIREEDAERFVEEVRNEDPELAGLLSVDRVELHD